MHWVGTGVWVAAVQPALPLIHRAKPTATSIHHLRCPHPSLGATPTATSIHHLRCLHPSLGATSVLRLRRCPHPSLGATPTATSVLRPHPTTSARNAAFPCCSDNLCGPDSVVLFSVRRMVSLAGHARVRSSVFSGGVYLHTRNLFPGRLTYVPVFVGTVLLIVES